MTTTTGTSLWETMEHTPSPRQRAFLRYLTATLVDLVVLNLFVEYWEYVSADSFTITLLAAVLLQVLLKLTIVLEHRVAAYFNAKQGGFAKFMRFFSCLAGAVRVQVRDSRSARPRVRRRLAFRRPLPWDRGPDRGGRSDARGRSGSRDALPPPGLRMQLLSCPRTATGSERGRRGADCEHLRPRGDPGTTCTSCASTARRSSFPPKRQPELRLKSPKCSPRRTTQKSEGQEPLQKAATRY